MGSSVLTNDRYSVMWKMLLRLRRLGEGEGGRAGQGEGLQGLHWRGGGGVQQRGRHATICRLWRAQEARASEAGLRVRELASGGVVVQGDDGPGACRWS